MDHLQKESAIRVEFLLLFFNFIFQILFYPLYVNRSRFYELSLVMFMRKIHIHFNKKTTTNLNASYSNLIKSFNHTIITHFCTARLTFVHTHYICHTLIRSIYLGASQIQRDFFPSLLLFVEFVLPNGSEQQASSSTLTIYFRISFFFLCDVHPIQNCRKKRKKDKEEEEEERKK